MSMYYFLHPSTGRSWSTDDPHHWLLNRRDDKLLAAARERLLASPEDTDRCLRVVLRRCRLALVRVVAENKIVVQHWSESAPDLRDWAKEYGFNRPGVRAVLVNVKTGKVVVHDDGLDLLVYGERAGDKFPWPEFRERYERRMVEEADDEDAAVASATNFMWPGVAEPTLTWKVLKAIWSAESVVCPNCDRAVLAVVGFSWRHGMLSWRPGNVVRYCLWCRRRFAFNEERPLAWLASVLGPHLRPTHLALWRRFGIEWSDPNPRLV